VGDRRHGEDAVITRQEIRAVLGDGGRMVDAEGQLVGRILDVVLDWRTSQPEWATVDCPMCSGSEVVVPLGRACLRDGSVQVPYSVAEVCGAPRGHGSAGPSDAERSELRAYYAVRGEGAPEAAAEGRAAHGGRAPEVSSGSRHADLGLDALSGVPLFEVRAPDDGPAVDVPAIYPGNSAAPWPPVRTSSPGPPWWQRCQWRWSRLPASVRAMRMELRTLLDLTGLPGDELEDLALAASEAADNAVEHARFPGVPYFDVLGEVGAHRARIVIQDHGRWQPPSTGSRRGRGLRMIGVLADATLTVGPQGTTVVLRNRRAAGD
jgi:anti-sigma regulatory factor (Ser/Thr protein kinase)